MNPVPVFNPVAQPKELNLVKPNCYYGRDDEDPFDWLASFEYTAIANQWNDNRKPQIAAEYLKDSAARWFDDNQDRIVYWDNPGNPYNFTDQFIHHFANATMKNKWMSDLDMLRQQPTQTVGEYAEKFKALIDRVDPTRTLNAEYRVRKFIRGLSPHLMTMVVGHCPPTLDAAIQKAKEIETGFAIAQPVQQQQVMANQVELLQQQVAQLSANLLETQK